MCAAALGIYPREEARSIAYMVAESLYDLTKTDIVANPDVPVEGFDRGRFDEILRQIAGWRPVQYVLGETDFFGLKFNVAEGVLIPRPETEELVQNILKHNSDPVPLNILDIGTGSGAIAIALAVNMLQACVDALDVSPDALCIARSNAELNSAKVSFIEADILCPAEELRKLLPRHKYDIIVSNPPYIPDSERAMMRENVTRYEPAGALFVPDGDPLLFYREIGVKAYGLLKPAGQLWFEVHENLAEDVCRLLRGQGYGAVECLRDMNGKDRMVVCRKI